MNWVSDLLKSMENLFLWVSWCVLLWTVLSCASEPTYEWRDPKSNEKLLCQKCPPGTSMAQHCTKDTPTICKPCPDQYFTQYWNYLERCLYCSVFCNTMEVEVVACNRTHNRVCQCKPGYHAEWLFCIEHSKCLPGSGVVQPGNPREDTKCRACPEGTFSSNHSSRAVCGPHQNCSAQGLRVNVPGNQVHDALCTSCRAGKGLEEGSGSGECQEAAIDFVPFQIKSVRKLRRLQRKLGRSPPGPEKKKSKEELQVDLHTQLIQLKSMHGKERVWERLQDALEKMKLQNFLETVQKQFLVGL
ncbi:tumor necrosis factor receptor superfamily member 6B [Candoia aspera]|uniref:tumor necrosis factor receptor superfamily member 6B n=1 Tax=Candoia aspera TaxID=51853 RepID=UPI002FD7B9A5